MRDSVSSFPRASETSPYQVIADRGAHSPFIVFSLNGYYWSINLPFGFLPVDGGNFGRTETLRSGGLLVLMMPAAPGTHPSPCVRSVGLQAAAVISDTHDLSARAEICRRKARGIFSLGRASQTNQRAGGRAVAQIMGHNVEPLSTANADLIQFVISMFR